MAKYEYIGESNIHITKGAIVDSHVTTWSVKIPCSTKRINIESIYVDGWLGKQVGLPVRDFKEL